MPAPLECPRCRGHMDEGYMLDVTHGGAFPQSWVEGPPEKSFWTGTKTKGHLKLQVRTYRCERCGLLESYASDSSD